MPCRWVRRKTWTHRLMLERFCHKEAAFVTLTYDDDHLIFDWRTRAPILWKKDVQDFLKRLRDKLHPMKFRFYAVGEYGDKSERPHYHLVLYGYPSCARGSTQNGFCCPACFGLREIWSKGNVFVGQVSSKSAGYVASYTVKKMTSSADPRLKGRTPEFCTMSLRPGIGAEAMWDVASDLMSSGADGFLLDVPTGLAHGKKIMPFGRYLRDKLRNYIGKEGVNFEDSPYAKELRALWEYWFASTKGIPASQVVPFGTWVSSLDDSKYASIVARNEIFKKGKRL